MFFLATNVKFFVELPTFDYKICLLQLKIIPFCYPKTKFKHTLKQKKALQNCKAFYDIAARRESNPCFQNENLASPNRWTERAKITFL